MTQQDSLNWMNGGWKSSPYVRTIPGVGTGIDVDKLYGFQLKDMWYSVIMKVVHILSKTYGSFEAIVDDDIYDRIKELGGKWSITKQRSYFYAEKRIGGVRTSLHRFVMNNPLGKYVDHISRDTLDNRRSNLRVCSNAANIRNGKTRTTSTTGVNGVYTRVGRKKWYARIRVNYKIISLGAFDKFEDAVEARKVAERKYWDV